MTDVLHFQVSGFLTSALNIFLVLFVSFRAPRNPLKSLFICYGIAIAWWSFFVSLFSIVDNQRASYFFCQTLHASSIFIPCIFLHLILHYLKRRETNQIFISIAAYVVSSFFWIQDVFLPHLFIARVVPKLGYPYFMEPGPFYHYWMVFFFAVVIYGHVLLLKGITQTRGELQKQRLFFFIGNAIGYFGGLGAFLPVYNITIFPYPYGTYGVALFSAVTAYSIIRHRLMDIEVIIKKTLVFAGLFGMVMAIVAGVTTLTQNYLSRYFAVSTMVSTMVSVILAILLYDPTRRILIHVTDRFLFQKKEDFKITLKRLSENIITLLELDRVGKAILSTLERSLRLASGALLVKDENEKLYQVLDAFGMSSEVTSLEKDDPLIRFLANKGEIVYLGNQERKNELPPEALKVIEDFGAVIVVPLFFQKDLIGALFLGRKKSDQEFTRDETDYFPTVASEAALALRNARLHEILMKGQIDFAQQAKMAAIGTLASGIGHEVKNPLNNIKGTIGMLKFQKNHGLYEAKPAEEVLKEIFEALEIMEKNVDRATDVINRLQSFAKKPKELRAEKISLEDALESAIAFVSHQLEMSAIEIVKSYRSKTPFILADRGAIEDALLNLLTNAAHATKGAGTLTLTLLDRNSEIELSIRDTGSGIASEHLEKIFDPFFTTKDVTRSLDSQSIKGTGLGLFIVREIIKRFNGKISVESELGKGTIFHILFPAYEETQNAAQLG